MANYWQRLEWYILSSIGIRFHDPVQNVLAKEIDACNVISFKLFVYLYLFLLKFIYAVLLLFYFKDVYAIKKFS